jgi:hypothetical protein
MNEKLVVEQEFHFDRVGRGAGKRLRGGAASPVAGATPGRVPRVAKLMALAIRFDGLIRVGDVADYADLARLGHVTRARITQIMNLTLLAPDIQEELLFLPRVERGHDTVLLKQLQPIAREPSWRKQRQLWQRLRGR